MAKVYPSAFVRQLADAQKIIDGFKAHIAGNTPNYFGRDVAYDHPDTPPVVREYLRHIHISNPLKDHPKKWNSIGEPFRRVNDAQKPQHDFALVYWHDQFNGAYYLYTVIGADAHNMNKWMPTLIAIAERARTKDLNIKN